MAPEKSGALQLAASWGYELNEIVATMPLVQPQGEKLVARSEARRLVLRIEDCQKVVLDFEGVSEIGQGFADELFRVFAAAHPAVELAPINMSEADLQMVSRARSAGNW